MNEFNDKDLNKTWEEWRHWILISIKKLNEQVEQIKENNHICSLEYTREITKLKTSATIWGVIGGAIITCIFSVISGITVYHVTTNYMERKTTQLEREFHIDQYERDLFERYQRYNEER